MSEDCPCDYCSYGVGGVTIAPDGWLDDCTISCDLYKLWTARVIVQNAMKDN